MIIVLLQVYGRFLAQDQDSGRTSYFITRKTYLKITDLVSDYLRVSDTQVAVIKGPVIQGVGPGRTEIQVSVYLQVFIFSESQK
jgi:transmembrane protein 132